MSDEVTITPLVCPRCGGGLAGLRWDRLFTCPPCALALLVEDGRTRLFPVTRARAVRPTDGERLLWLPFWELAVEVEITAPANGPSPLPGVAAGIERVWVAGFAARRPELFGEPGVPMTEGQVRLEPAAGDPEPLGMPGACREPALVERYARLTVLRILDRREDVTGVGVDVRVTRAGLWAVPFEDQGERLADLTTGASLPAAAFEDLAEIRAALGR
jgi:hypothetical protein